MPQVRQSANSGNEPPVIDIDPTIGGTALAKRMGFLSDEAAGSDPDPGTPSLIKTSSDNRAN